MQGGGGGRGIISNFNKECWIPPPMADGNDNTGGFVKPFSYGGGLGR